MNHCHQYIPAYSRRDFLKKTSLGLGAAALAGLISPNSLQASSLSDPSLGTLGSPHFPAKAKRVIYLFQSGGPSQLELFDHKPLLQERNGENLPESIRGKQRLTGMSAGQKSFPMAGSQFSFKRYGKSGAWFSELLPYLPK